MKHINLGTLDVWRIGLGAMGMSAAYTGAGTDDAESIRTIHRALDLGVTLIDTAEIYGPFTNEELVGRAIKGRRDDVVLATKFGLVSHAGGGPWHLDSSPANVRAAVEGSLSGSAPTTSTCTTSTGSTRRRPSKTPSALLAELVAEGKVRHIGLSEAWTPTRSAGRMPSTPITALQSEYSLWTRDPEPKVLPVLRELGHRIRRVLTARPRLPHGRGALHRRLRRRRHARRQPALHGRQLRAQPARWSTRSRPSRPRSVRRPGRSRSRGCSPRATTSPRSPAPRRVTRVEENVAADGIELSAEQIDQAHHVTPAAGDHHSEQQMQMIER